MAIALFILTTLLVALFWPRIVAGLSAPMTKPDRVDEAGLESFPSSDPPAWTLGVEAQAEVKSEGPTS